jgi:hypothetical protein
VLSGSLPASLSLSRPAPSSAAFRSTSRHRRQQRDRRRVPARLASPTGSRRRAGIAQTARWRRRSSGLGATAARARSRSVGRRREDSGHPYGWCRRRCALVRAACRRRSCSRRRSRSGGALRTALERPQIGSSSIASRKAEGGHQRSDRRALPSGPAKTSQAGSRRASTPLAAPRSRPSRWRRASSQVRTRTLSRLSDGRDPRRRNRDDGEDRDHRQYEDRERTGDVAGVSRSGLPGEARSTGKLPSTSSPSIQPWITGGLTDLMSASSSAAICSPGTIRVAPINGWAEPRSRRRCESTSLLGRAPPRSIARAMPSRSRRVGR